MANNPIEVLMSEHDVITGAKEVIAALEQLRLRDAAAYEAAMRELLSFFQSYSDGFHHQKEEQVLFPALTADAEFTSHAMLEELEEHHQAFRDDVAAIRRSLDEKDYEAAQKRVERYFDSLLDHIAVENDELFVMTESLLDPAELEKIYFRFKDVDRELGDDRKKELEAILHRLPGRSAGC